ncbi:MAG: hypothetical protein OEZ06_03440 [Myxococcales bacterium]|nr:hypothetical protein [Myxococcales bacterium]
MAFGESECESGARAEQASSERSIEQLENAITELSAHLSAATHRWLVDIAEFDRRAGWAGIGVASCAHWLNWRCGVSLVAAREKVRVARALEALPKICNQIVGGPGPAYDLVTSSPYMPF